MNKMNRFKFTIMFTVKKMQVIEVDTYLLMFDQTDLLKTYFSMPDVQD